MDGVVSRSRSARAAHEDRYVGPEHVPSAVGNEVYYQDDVAWTATSSIPETSNGTPSSIIKLTWPVHWPQQVASFKIHKGRLAEKLVKI
jgi:hypothetical protein